MLFCLNSLHFDGLEGSETEPATVCEDEVWGGGFAQNDLYGIDVFKVHPKDFFHTCAVAWALCIVDSSFFILKGYSLLTQLPHM